MAGDESIYVTLIPLALPIVIPALSAIFAEIPFGVALRDLLKAICVRWRTKIAIGFFVLPLESLLASFADTEPVTSA